MADIKLFRISGDHVEQLPGEAVVLEKSLQTLIERHLEVLLGVRFLASEYSTGKTHRGRIDTLGIDENGFPVIIEYKRAVNENVINQGLFYLDWLLDHRGEFKLLVLERYGSEVADTIEWSNPRLLCIAGDFTRYDEHAVQQMNRSVELIRYSRYGNDLLMLDLVNAISAQTAPEHKTTESKITGLPRAQTQYKTATEFLEQAPPTLQDLFYSFEAFVTALGGDVQKKTLKDYFAYKRIKNFASVVVQPRPHTLLVYAKVNPDEIELEQGFTRNVRGIGHYGTGDLEIRIRNHEDMDRAKGLIIKSYEAS